MKKSLVNFLALWSPWSLMVLIFPLFLFFFLQFHSLLAFSDGAHYMKIAIEQFDFFNQGFSQGIESIYFWRSPGN